MLELLITAVTSIAGTFGIGWLVLFRWKKGALLSKLTRETTEEKLKLYDLLDKKIEELGIKVHQLREREMLVKKHIGVLFRECRCGNSAEVKKLRELYNAREDQASGTD